MNLNKYIPNINKASIRFSREEENDCRSIIVANHFLNNPIMFNKTSTYILNLIDGKNSLKDILDHLIRNYKEVDKEVLEEDLLSIMENFWLLSLIFWKTSNPFMEKYKFMINDKTLIISHESEFIEIYKTIKGNLVFKTPTLNLSIFLKEENLFEYLYNKISFFFILKEGDRIVASTLLTIDNSVLNSLECVFLAISPNIEDEELKLMFQKILNYVSTNPKNFVYNKINFYIPEHSNKYFINNKLFGGDILLKDYCIEKGESIDCYLHSFNKNI